MKIAAVVLTAVVHLGLIWCLLGPNLERTVANEGAVMQVRLVQDERSHFSAPAVVLFPVAVPMFDPAPYISSLSISTLPPAPKDDLLAGYLPGATLDRHPVPISEPDRSSLQAASGTGLPIRFRLFVDSNGNVIQVLPTAASDEDALFVDGVKRMFLATRFIPGGKGGENVPSYIDIEVMPGN